MNISPYADVRPRIKSGMVVFFEAHTLAAKAITAITGGRYSHCGLSVVVDDEDGAPRLMLAEATFGGFRLISMDSFSKRRAVVVDVGLDWPIVRDYVLDKTGSTAYGYLDFVLIGLRELLVRTGIGSRMRMPDLPGEVCSEAVAKTLTKGGLKLSSTTVSPSKLFELVHPKHRFVQRFAF